jgi:hypothetical protein
VSEVRLHRFSEAMRQYPRSVVSQTSIKKRGPHKRCFNKFQTETLPPGHFFIELVYASIRTVGIFTMMTMSYKRAP